MSESRTNVVDRMQLKDNVEHASPIGNCVRVVLSLGHPEINTFTKLYEETGWYVAEYESRDERPDQMVLSPGDGDE